MTTKLSHINYSFSTEGLHPVLVCRHADFVRDRLATLFGIKADAVNVTSKKRLPEGVPFTLTCYAGASESDPVSMARAAKYVLPHLEDMGGLTKEYATELQEWTPGRDIYDDLSAVCLVGEGFGDLLCPAQAEWLAARAQAFAPAGESSSQTHARIVSDVLTREIAALRAKQLRQEEDKKAEATERRQRRAQERERQSNYDYQRVRVKRPGLPDTTVSMQRLEYISMVRASKLSLVGLNRLIRAVAAELIDQPQTVPFSRAVVTTVRARLEVRAA